MGKWKHSHYLAVCVHKPALLLLFSLKSAFSSNFKGSRGPMRHNQLLEKINKLEVSLHKAAPGSLFFFCFFCKLYIHNLRFVGQVREESPARLSGSNQTKWKIRSPAERQPLGAADQSSAGSGAEREPCNSFFFVFFFSQAAFCGTSFSAAASFHFHKGEPRPARTKREPGDISLWSSEEHQIDGSDTLFF